MITVGKEFTYPITKVSHVDIARKELRKALKWAHGFEATARIRIPSDAFILYWQPFNKDVWLKYCDDRAGQVESVRARLSAPGYPGKFELRINSQYVPKV